MPKKKTEAAQAAPSKSAKATKKTAAKPGKSEMKSATKAAKVANEKAKKAEPKRKNVKHEDVPDAVVLAALDGGWRLGKAELVAACGGDSVAVTKTVQRLRGTGQIVATGTSRSTVYSKAA